MQHANVLEISGSTKPCLNLIESIDDLRQPSMETVMKLLINNGFTEDNITKQIKKRRL